SSNSPGFWFQAKSTNTASPPKRELVQLIYPSQKTPILSPVSNSWSRTGFQSLLGFVELCGFELIENEPFGGHLLKTVELGGGMRLLQLQIHLQPGCTGPPPASGASGHPTCISPCRFYES